MPGKFVLKKGSTGKFRFSLLSTNGQIVATSEAYNSKASAMKGVESVRRFAADATLDDQTAGGGATGVVKKAAKKVAKKATAAKKR